MNGTQQASRVYALLADGTTVEIRPATPADFDAVMAMYEAMSPDNTYLRFFNLSRRAAEAEAQRTCRDPSPGHVSLLALSGDVVVGCASYYTSGATAAPADQVIPGAPVTSGAPVMPVTAEIAFAVAEHMHHRGIATLLLEHLVSVAASHQVQAFTAGTLAENTAMLKVFADAGLPVHRRYAGAVVELTFPIPRTDADPALGTYRNAVAGRERLADVASLRHLFAPESVVVIGASRSPGTVGRAILDNVRTGGYLGRLYAVNPHAEPIGGVPCWPAVADLPEAPDLAVIAVPAASVLDTVEQCGRRGVQSVVVITSGLDADGCAGLLAACRRHGMRLVGPNCFGVAVPGIGLDATFAASHPRPGSVGLVTQSGGLGFAMVDQLSRLGIGISSFASVGNKLDVSSNDLLLWWEQDGLTKLAVLYIESFGNPRKFARTARRVGATMPVLTVHAGRSAAGQRAAASHTAAVATPLVSREALFAQAGIIATPGLGELTEVTALLATQPVPAGGTVAIVSNVGGAGVLTADACAVHHPAGQTSRKLRALLPGGTVSGPVDTTAAVSGADFRQCLELLAADEDVDAMIVLVLPTAATGDLTAAIAEADLDVPVAAVVLNQPETVRLITRASGGQLPAYGFPEAAVTALARAVRYGAWRAEPSEPVPDFADIRPADARALVYRFLDDAPAGGWLPPGPAAELLRCYGITLTGLTPVASEDEAVAAAAATGGPVVLKADVPGLVHKTDAGAVQLDLRTQADVRDAYRSLQSRFTGRLRRILVQPMIIGGTEVIIGVVDDHMFGPLVVFGLGGVATEVLADHAARLTPLSGTDADQLIGSIRSARLLLGHRGTPAADLGALRELLLRVSRLADDLPEITDLDLNPVIARPDGAFAVDARVKVAPYQPEDPYLRKLK
jgi:acyl-CoA synthetase (NDP forming)/GNAT superfamily N-acetyltransferase